jgi:hypothetical protein
MNAMTGHAENSTNQPPTSPRKDLFQILEVLAEVKIF